MLIRLVLICHTRSRLRGNYFVFPFLDRLYVDRVSKVHHSYYIYPYIMYVHVRTAVGRISSIAAN